MTKPQQPMSLTRFLIISDTHNFEFSNATGAFRLPIPKVDVLLHCGDLTNIGGSSAFKATLKMLGSINTEVKLVMAEFPPKWRQPGRSQKEHLQEHATAMGIMTGPLATEVGVSCLEEGTHTFTLKSGARFTVNASPYQPKIGGWAFGYQRRHDQFILPGQVAKGVVSIAKHPVPDFPGVDIMMTHGPPKGILDKCGQGSVGCENLLRAAGRARPRLHCFGHIHEGYDLTMVAWDTGTEEKQKNPYPEGKSLNVDFGRETLMVSASIRNEEDKADNAPWLIDLELPCV